MTKKLVILMAAVVVVGAAGGAAVWYLTPSGAVSGELPPPAPLPVVEAAPQEPLPPIPEPAAPAPAPTPAPQPPKDPRPERPAHNLPPGRPEIGRVGATPTQLFAALRPFGQAVTRCSSGSAPGPARPPVTISLRMETLQDAVKVTGVTVPKGSPASDLLLRCARQELVGRELPAPGSTPGHGYALPYPVRP